MEIDIPSLDDVQFTQTCTMCNGTGKTWEYENPRSPRSSKHGEVTCWRCKGKPLFLSPVGERLVAFLRELGIGVDIPEKFKR